MIVFIIVIYKVKLSNCITLSSLLGSLETSCINSFRILVLDNSDGPCAQDKIDSKFDYVSFGANIGLARAYKYGVNYCRNIDAQFMVTLDQDSLVTPAYIRSVFKYINIYAGHEIVLCPRILCGDRKISPYSYSIMGTPNYTSSEKLHAINSFTVYSVCTLVGSDIIDDFYWLDALDFSIFENLYRNGIAVKVMDVEVQHNLSLLDFRISNERLANIALYEAAFLFQYCNPVRCFAGTVRLILRMHRRIRHTNRIRILLNIHRTILKGASTGLVRRLNKYMLLAQEK